MVNAERDQVSQVIVVLRGCKEKLLQFSSALAQGWEGHNTCITSAWSVTFSLHAASWLHPTQF